MGKGGFYGCYLSVVRGIFRDWLLHVICHSETEKKQKKPGKLSPKSFQAWSCKHLLRGFGGIIPLSSPRAAPPALWYVFSIAHLGICVAGVKSKEGGRAAHLPEVSTCVKSSPTVCFPSCPLHLEGIHLNIYVYFAPIVTRILRRYVSHKRADTAQRYAANLNRSPRRRAGPGSQGRMGSWRGNITAASDAWEKTWGGRKKNK